jgi:putative FmdB family regulatory protein
MPIYQYKCTECGVEGLEVIAKIDSPTPPCPRCKTQMEQVMTVPAMVKIKGEGGYPSRRKFVKGSAPGTTRSTKVWGDHDPSDKSIDYMGTKK